MLRYFHTIRHLRCRQVSGQVHNRLRAVLEKTSANSLPTSPPYQGCRWDKPLPSPPINGSGALQPEAVYGKFTFLNRTEALDWPPRWRNPELPRLWQYNLHYFDWIHGLEYAQAREAAVSWIRNHQLVRRNIGWEPYPTSLRLVNWALFFLGQNRENIETDVEFTDLLWKSLCLQAYWLERHLEYHLLANHLFENAACLAFVGSCFSGPDADRWKGTGMEILHRELNEQVVADGVHFERSPMYHSRILYVLLLLAATGDKSLVDLVKEPVFRMNTALKRLCHPDGRIALLGDSAFGIHAEPKELFDYAALLFPGMEDSGKNSTSGIALGKAGYYGWNSSSEGNYIICNAGPIAPDYQPGHSHADIFSFELSLGGKRIVVDSGVTGYEPGQRRTYCRSTQAHNTVEIAGQDQSEMWGAFRVARRARVNDLEWNTDEGGFTLQASHDGYSRIHRGLEHQRRFEWNAAGRLCVTDTVNNFREGEAISRLHLHPGCIIKRLDSNSVSLARDSVKANIVFHGAGRLEIAESEYYPEFGKILENKVLEFVPETGADKWSFEINW